MTGHQKRIATTCGAGEFVVGIQENGDPLCESPFDTVIEDISGDGWSDTKTIEQQPFGMLLHGYIWLTKSCVQARSTVPLAATFSLSPRNTLLLQITVNWRLHCVIGQLTGMHGAPYLASSAQQPLQLGRG